jgi:hypothetical protein
MSNGILGINNPLEKMAQSDDFLASEESKNIREGLGFYMTPDMYLTEQEKADRPGGKTFSEPLNFIRSLALMGPSKPKDFTQVTGQETEDKFDDIFYEKYTTDFYKNVPSIGGVVPIKEVVEGQTISPEAKERFEKRVAMTGSNPIGNALGILELSTVAQLIPFLATGAKKGINLAGYLARRGRTPDEIKEIENFFDATFPNEVKQRIVNAQSQDEAVEIIMDRFQPAGGSAGVSDILTDGKIKIINSAVETGKINQKQADILLSEGKAVKPTKGKVAGEDLLRLYLTKLGGPGGQRGPRLGFKKATKEDEELLDLYKQIMNNKIEPPLVFRFPAIKSSDFGFDGLSQSSKNSTVYNLKKLNFYMKQKKKYKGLSEPEIRAKFEKELPGVLDDMGMLDYQKTGVIQPVNARNSITQELLKILNLKRIELPPATPLNVGTLKGGAYELKGVPDVAYVFKDIGPEDIKKIKELHNRFLNGRLMTVPTANDVAILTRDSKLKKMITKDGKVPSLDELNAAMFENYTPNTPGFTSSEAGSRINRIIDYINGEDIILPANYDQINPFTVNFPRNKNLAKKLIKDLNEKAAQGSWFSHYGVAERNVYITQADKILLRPNGKRQMIIKRFRENNKTSDAVHELAGIRTTGKNNMDSYGNFVMLIDQDLNRALGSLQGELGTQNVQWLRGNITLDEYIDVHNNIIKKNVKVRDKVINAKPYLAEIMKPSEVTTYYTKAERKLFKEKYGMDLVKEANKAGYAYKIPRNADDGFTLLDDLAPKGNAMGGTPILRKDFQEGTQDITSFDQFGDVPGTVNASIKAVQEQVKSMYADERVDFITEPIERYQLEAAELREELQKRLNPPQPVKFKFSELPKLVTESPVLRSFLGDPRVYALETAELFYNGIRPGVENDVEMEKLFPSLYAMHNLATGTGVDPTPKEQTYISMIDEINRAQEKGFANFGYNVADLLLSIPDAVLPTQFTEEVKRQYEDMDLAEPETFIGNLGALIVEYGIPGSIGFKIINRFKKSISAATKGKADKYLFTRKTYKLEGLPKYGVQISNVAKRVGSTSLAFGAADFVAGGPYNTLTEMFDDPLLSDKLVGQLEDVENLTGKERVAANFRNRLRYGAEGAMIGGLFPLVGPALGAIGKNVLLKPALFAGKYGVVYPVNYLAIKPITYLASKDPVVLPGIARGAGAFAQFLGKDVLARLAATAATGGKAFVPSLKGNLGQLPDFQQWRMFDVASNDPLERGLRKVDNFLKWFRDSGNQALYSFNLSGGAERFIKAKSREIEKYLDSIERKSYDLANGFLKRYNQSTTSPAGERHMLEQVYEYLRGNLKLSKLEPELQDISKSLKAEFDQIKKAFVGELPEGSGLRAFLESNLDKYMRASFAVFTNPRFTPADDIVKKATDFMVNVINKNEDFIEAAIKGVPVTEQAQAIRAFAKTNVENMISLGRREGIDPIEVLKQINRQILRDDDTIVQTGEELPKVIRQLLGEEKSLRASVMTTASSLVTQTSNLRAFKEMTKHGLENGYLFTSRAEALAAGVTDPRQIGNLPGLGGLQDLATVDKDGPIGLFASNELKQTIEGTGGMLDSLLQNSFYQSLIAYKAGVQTGKTVFSPATQTRNFGSAGFFPLNVGHIGGNASVTDAFKIVMDDIFGAGRVVNESDLIKRISRKIELGVLDENIVASELSAILNDIKGGKLKALGALSERVDSSKLFKTATRVYAGGDNVWKWYGHEFYMSQLKGAFKSFDDVKRYMQDFHGVDINQRNIFGGGIKNLDEGIEEAAAYLLRETYPTYSKVPEFIKAIRKLPIGNFVSFTSEILRTSFATSAIALKHIASDNPVLREMGYRSLAGQAITLGGVTTGVQGLAHAMTNVTPTQLEVYKEYFAPDYMKFSSLVPVTNVEDGVFEVFDISRYHPYDIVTSSARELLKVADRQFHDERIAKLTEDLKSVDPASPEGKRIRDQIKDLSIKAKMGQTLDPDKITVNALTQYLNAVGPLYNAVTGTFFGIPIGAEAFLEASRGKTLEGSTIWNTNMPPTEIFDRAMGHFFKTIEPGLISSGRKLLYAARGDVSGVGQPLEISTEGFKLMGGSNVKVDILGSLDFKISGDFLSSFREPKMGRDYYDTVNFQQRGPDQLVREYRQQNEDAFRMQYEFYKASEAAIESGLLTRTQIIQALQKRIAPDSKSISRKVAMFVSGRYTPITYGPEGLKSRREKIIRRNPDLDQSMFNYQYFLPIGLLELEKAKWTGLRFEDFERQQETQQQSAVEQPAETPVAAAPEIQTPPVQETGSPVVAPQPVAGANPTTGLTTTETALLSPGEAAIRQKQRATGVV